MTIARTTFTAVLIALGLAATSRTVQAAPGDHMDRLALSLQAQAQRLSAEVRLHYRHTPEYRHLISDARKIYVKAVHIHRIAHRGTSRAHLASDLREIDALYHHTAGLIREIERHAHFGHGHVHGDTRHVRGILAQMRKTIHHMMSDVGLAAPPTPVPDPFGGHVIHGRHSSGHGRYHGGHGRYHGGHRRTRIDLSPHGRTTVRVGRIALSF